ncbi:MAG TPA: hypothetical protein VLM38_22350 [Blastocatellia bacterium]|nr:hypothetical protein [Blastocatellia bacterium]
MNTCLLFCLLLSIELMAVPVPAPAQQAIDTNLAEQYFQQAEAICRQDDAKLWGIRLCGPMLLADPRTRNVVANQGDAESHLSKKGNVFVGRLPDSVNIANTATTWAGIKWTMIMWPLPSNEHARASLMFHELFHRVQDDLGLPAANPANNHLDSLEGRIWLQLEWRALAAALAKQGAESKSAIEDALVFRAYRRSLFSNSENTERALEMNEGLCEYTGGKLRGTSEEESAAYIVKQLEGAEQTPTFVRSFAYASGPAYGFLLDRSKVDWRKGLRQTDDFGALAERLLSLKVPVNLRQEAELRSARYNGATLRASETERDAKRKKRLADYRAKFIDRPVLILTLGEKQSYSFDPNNIESFDDIGTVYPTLRVSDEWGVLEVTGGALMIRDRQKGSRVQVPAPADRVGRKIQGDGWTLELNDGWSIALSERKGDFAVTRGSR